MKNTLRYVKVCYACVHAELTYYASAQIMYTLIHKCCIMMLHTNIYNILCTYIHAYIGICTIVIAEFRTHVRIEICSKFLKLADIVYSHTN